MLNRDGCENRKNKLDGIWLNPKYYKTIGNSATYPRTEDCSTTIAETVRVGTSVPKRVTPVMDEEIVCAGTKVPEVHNS